MHPQLNQINAGSVTHRQMDDGDTCISLRQPAYAGNTKTTVMANEIIEDIYDCLIISSGVCSQQLFVQKFKPDCFIIALKLLYSFKEF